MTLFLITWFSAIFFYMHFIIIHIELQLDYYIFTIFHPVIDFVDVICFYKTFYTLEK